jgi:tetratricopeptide (TPR) repeat protein
MPTALAANYYFKKNWLEVQICYWKSLNIYEGLEDQQGMASTFNAIGDVYQELGDSAKAIDYYQRAIAHYKKLGHRYGMMGCLANIAGLYEANTSYLRALTYYSQAYQLAASPRDSAYMEGKIGLIQGRLHQFSTALAWETAALQRFRALSEGQKDPYHLSKALGNMADIYFEQGRIDTAVAFLQKAILVADSVNGNWARRDIGNYYLRLANTYLDQAADYSALHSNRRSANRYRQLATQQLQAARQVATRVEDYTLWRDYFKTLLALQQTEGKYEEALVSYGQYTRYKDSLNARQKIKELTAMEVTYREVKKDEYTRQVQQRRWGIAIASGILFAFITYFVVQARWNRNRAAQQVEEQAFQRQLSDLKLSAIRSQMNPHFIFNALTAIQSYIYNNDKQLAMEALSKFSSLMRRILENSDKKCISLQNECETLELYLAIEQARVRDGFECRITVNTEPGPAFLWIPPMLIQPYIENAVKHGLWHRVGDKKLIVFIETERDTNILKVTIDDNGVGRKASAGYNMHRPAGHHSYANAANATRIALLHPSQNENILPEIIDKEDSEGRPEGTTVILRIPFEWTPD